MSRHISLTFPMNDVEVVASLHEDEAPLTCQRLWELLAEPIDGLARHEPEMGMGLCLPMPAPVNCPLENASAFPIPGDLIFFAVPGMLPRGEMRYAVELFSARDGRGPLRVGWTAGTVFASVTDNLQGLERVVKAVLDRGAQPVRIARGGV